MASPLFVVCLVLVFVCSLMALEQIEGFSRGARWIVAAGTAFLSALGLTSGSGDPPSQAGSELEGILLPYAALGLTLIVLLILLVLAKFLLVIRAVKRRLCGRNGREDRASAAQAAKRRRSPAQNPIDHSRLP